MTFRRFYGKKINNIAGLVNDSRNKKQEFSFMLMLTMLATPEKLEPTEWPYSNIDVQHTEIPFVTVEEYGKALNRNFFESLYTKREVEEFEVRNSLLTNHISILTGLVGEGKSTLIKHVLSTMPEDEFHYYILVDALAYSKYFSESLRLDESLKRIEHLIILQIQDHLILERGLNLKWEKYQLRHLEEFSQLRNKLWNNELSEFDNVENIFSEVSSGKYQDIYMKKCEICKPDLSDYLKFISENNIFLVIVLDNLDRLSIESQMAALAFMDIIIHTPGERSGLVSIRYENYRKVQIMAQERLKQRDPLHGLSIIHTLQQVILKSDKKQITELDGSKIKSLIARRLDFLKNQNIVSIQDLYYEYRQENPNAISPLSFEQYEMNFWDVFDQVSQSFVSYDINQLCNKSLRHILALYSNFINKLLMNEEDDYRFEKFLLDTRNITELRNFFYRYVLSDHNTNMPNEKTLGPLVFDNLDSPPFWINHKLLNYCVLYYSDENSKALQVKDLVEVFAPLNVSRATIYDRLVKFSEPFGNNHMNYLLIDNLENGYLEDDSIIEVLPSTKYFVNTLALSREFIFWNILMIDKENRICSREINYNQTYSDYFKTQTILKYLEIIMIRDFEDELNHYNQFCRQQTNQSNLGFYKSINKMTGKFNDALLIQAILRSLMSTLDHSLLKQYERSDFMRRIRALRSRISQLLQV